MSGMGAGGFREHRTLLHSFHYGLVSSVGKESCFFGKNYS